MKRPSFTLLALLLTTILLCSQSAKAQEADTRAVDPPKTTEKEWYYGPTTQPEPMSLAHQKAAVRGQQRLARLNSKRWYGFTPGRPTAAGMPFTTMYSPAWTRPGGRPFAWYISHRPSTVVSPYYYYR